MFAGTIRLSVAATDARGAGLLTHEQASRLVSEPFWTALREGRKPTSPGPAPALAGDYAGLSHAIVVGTSELEQRSPADTNQAAPVMTA